MISNLKNAKASAEKIDQPELEMTHRRSAENSNNHPKNFPTENQVESRVA